MQGKPPSAVTAALDELALTVGPGGAPARATTGATRFQADTDMFVVPKVFCNRLDPSSVDGMSAKLGLDATAPLSWDVERTTLPAEAVEAARALIARHAL